VYTKQDNSNNIVAHTGPISREIFDFLASAKDSVLSNDINVTNRCAGPVNDAKYYDYSAFVFIEICLEKNMAYITKLILHFKISNGDLRSICKICKFTNLLAKSQHFRFFAIPFCDFVLRSFHFGILFSIINIKC